MDLRLVDTFMIGFSPKEGTSLSNYLLNKKKQKKEDLIEAGLAYYSMGRVMDFFRNRVMFPLFDHRGNVVGFSGRAIEEPYSGGKYINTRDTLVYHKGSMFFGLNTAKEEVKKLDKAIILEGELDVISCFSQGIKNTIAVKGTALTENQVALVSRFTNNICLCFDADEAGFEATKRSLPALEKKGINITSVVFGSAKDADEAVKNDPVAFKKAIRKDLPVYDYIFQKEFLQNDKNRVDGKRRITDELLPIISRIQNEIVKEHYLKKLGNDLDVSLDALLRELENIQKKESASWRKENVTAANPSIGGKRPRSEMLEEYLMSLIIQHENPQIILEKVLEILKDYKFKIASYQKIVDCFINYFKEYGKYVNSSFLRILPKELTAAFDTAFLFPLPKIEDSEKYEKEAEKVAGEMRVLFLKNKIKETSLSLKAKEKEEDLKKIEDLEKELSSTIAGLS